MAIVSIAAAPYSADLPSLVLNYDELHSANALQLQCTANAITGNFPTEFSSIATFCGPGDEKPKRSTRSFSATVWLSYGAGGSFTELYPLSGKLVKFAYLPISGDAVSVDNPEFSGQCWVPNFAPFSASEPEEPQSVDMEFRLFQALVDTIDPLAAVWTHPGGPAI